MQPEVLPHIKESFDQAISLDPKYALAHSEYGIYFIMTAVLGFLPANQALPQVRAHALQALELDPGLPEGHAMLGVAAAYLDYNWKETERHFKLAMAHPTFSPLVRFLYGATYLVPTGRAEEAVEQSELALQEDPFNSFMQIQRVLFLVSAGRDEEAARRLHQILELNPEISPASGFLGLHHFLRGELELALPLMEKSYALAPNVPNPIGGLAGLLSLTGNTARAEELIGKLQPDTFGAPRALAVYHWMRGDLDALAHWLEKAIDQHDPSVPGMLRQWYGRRLRDTPHWSRLLRKLNLPES
jgi:tetratricopeptide (TPR) repeat protein